VVASPKMLEELAEQAERIWRVEARGGGDGVSGVSGRQVLRRGGRRDSWPFAKEQGVDLLVMGTHGATGFTHALWAPWPSGWCAGPPARC